jgi:hypothetical protein
MSETGSTAAAVRADLAEAQAALAAFAAGPAQAAAASVRTAFHEAGVGVSRALVAAADDGEKALKRLARAALLAVADDVARRIAPTPAQARSASAPSDRACGGAVHVHFHLNGGRIDDVARHQGQIAAHLTRAVLYGRRNM